MPGRLIAMSSSPTSAADGPKRASGRVRRQPDPIYTSSPLTNGKRKRNEGDDPQVDDVEDGPEEDADEESEPSSEGEPDEEELREQKSRARKSKSTAATKPAAKRTKANGTHTLPIRAAGGRGGAKTKRPPKKAKAMNATAAEEAGGLYGTFVRLGLKIHADSKQ